jgi:putative thioredoxin
MADMGMAGPGGFGAKAPGMPAGALVKDATTASFSADVITESVKQPVLVDFWAPWCEPCKQLTPILEKVVAAAAGKVKLVKMNIDEHPQIPGQLGVRSIPAVFAFQRGRPVDGFMGALPESQVKAFIERLVGGAVGDAAEYLAAAEAALAEGDAQAAAEGFSAVLQEEPENVKALAGLARAFVALGDIEQAKQVLAAVPPAAANDPALATARAAVELEEQASTVGDLADLERRVAADPDDHQARFDLAIALNAKGQRDAAAEALLAIIKRDRSWNDDGARKQLLQFFDAWSLMDPATLSARRKLSTMLFS